VVGDDAGRGAGTVGEGKIREATHTVNGRIRYRRERPQGPAQAWRGAVLPGFLKQYLHNTPLSTPEDRVLKVAGYYFSAFISAVISVFEVIENQYQPVWGRHAPWRDQLSLDDQTLRDDTADLRNAELHQAKIKFDHDTKMVPNRELHPLRPLPPPRIVPPSEGIRHLRTSEPHTDVWAPRLSVPGHWSHGREVLSVCEECVRITEDFVHTCETETG